MFHTVIGTTFQDNARGGIEMTETEIETQTLTPGAPGTRHAPGTSRAPQSLRAVWPAMVGLSAVFLVEMLDNTLLNVALPTIGRDLHASATALQWVTGAYTVVFGGLMLLFGGIADRFGRRRVQVSQFENAVTIAILALATVAGALVIWAPLRARRQQGAPAL
jgi:hypothetical protein